MRLLWRILFIMALGAWLAYPGDFGLGVLLFQLLKVNPGLALFSSMLLIIVINTLLPLRLRAYRRYTQISLTLMCLILHAQAFAMGLLPLENYPLWLMSIALASVFILVAWPMIANRLWQWVHYQRAVDDLTA